MQAPSLKYCGKAKAARGSAKRSALCKHHHLLPWEGKSSKRISKEVCIMQAPFTYFLWEGRGSQENQQGGLHYASTITYFLWEGRAARGSARRSALCKPPSLTACGKGQRQQEISKGGLHYENMITHKL